MLAQKPADLNAKLSDKVYWHGYIPFYEQFFAQGNLLNIAEFGVYKGNSIRWLLERFPKSSIYGADILPLQSEWPVDPRFHFTQLNQESREQIRAFLAQAKFDLIIEDGSHLPQHQINCLVEGLDALNPNGLYVLEDIDTSRADHEWWNRKIHWWKFREKRILSFFKKQLMLGNALHLLLGLDHYQRIGVDVDDVAAEVLAKDSMLTKAEVVRLASQTKSIHLYRRTHLPDFCDVCGSRVYEFSKLRCLCGKPLFSDASSMAFVVVRK